MIYEKIYFEGEGRESYQGAGYDTYCDFPAHEERVSKLISITHPISVLDVGCAYGFIVRKLLDRGIYAVGMDISKWCERKARKIIPHNFIRHDIRQPLPFREKEFDVLYCEGVLEHIEEDKIEGIMKEFDRVALRRYIQVSFAHHKDVEKDYGHICIKEGYWWFEKVPFFTWVFLGDTGTEGDHMWFYKG